MNLLECVPEIANQSFHNMKLTAIILSVACAVGISSCCCQTQSMPKLRAFPKDCRQIELPQGQTPGQPPVKVLTDGSK